MLLLAILLLAAVGLLVAALVTGHIVLAWGSVGANAVVAVVLLTLRRRSGRRRREAAEVGPDSTLEDAEQADPLIATEQDDPVTAESQADPVRNGRPSGSDDVAEPGADGEGTEPGEEDTDAADLLVVWELPDEVLVVDEHPRYHLARCAWPDPACTERLPVHEARELGFTPCAQCRPDASLARRRRTASASQDEASVSQES